MQWPAAGVSITLVLVLMGAVVLFALWGRALQDSVREDLGATVLLSTDASEADAAALRKALQQAPYVCGCDYISAADALNDYIKQRGSDPTEFLDGNPFSASMELRMTPDYACGDSLARIRVRLKRAWPCIEEVIWQSELVDTVNANLRRIGFVLLGLAAMLAFISVALIRGTVLAGIFAGRFTIRTMKLVGAPWSFIRRPFLMRGLRLGLCSALAADVLLAVGVHALLRYDPTVERFVTPEMLAVTGGTVLLAGLLLTLFCTWLSVGRFLRMKASELY